MANEQIKLTEFRRPKDNRPEQESIQPDEKYNTASIPRGMIMPREYNSASDPSALEGCRSQAFPSVT